MSTSATAHATAVTTESNGAGGPIAARLADLRQLATSDPAAAQRETWSWIQELGAAKAESELDQLFRLGTPPQGLDGPTEGILVTLTIQPAADLVLHGITRAWMPWQGKSFDAANSRGFNRLTPSTRWVAKLLWPTYSTREDPSGRAAFDFETAVEPSRSDAPIEAMKIDYAPVETNPRLVIRSIRDELVELMPDTYLGKILWRSDSEPYPCIGYFALRQPAA